MIVFNVTYSSKLNYSSIIIMPDQVTHVAAVTHSLVVLFWTTLDVIVYL